MIIATTHLAFACLAQDELRQADPYAELLPDIAPGVLLAQGDFFSLAEQWRQRPPIFVRHICPVQATVPFSGGEVDMVNLRQALKDDLLDLIDPELSFSAQARTFVSAPYKPFHINTTLSTIIANETGAPLNVREPVQILSVVVAHDAIYLGVSLAVHNLSNWAGGARRFARDAGRISRAEFKLLEALETFNIQLSPRGIALDLGAAPGGWTRILRQQQQYVTAVDPAHLHPSLHVDKNIRHKRLTAEEYLAEYPDQFDLIVNDMILDARDSARLMARYAPYLYPHGTALMTLALPKNGRSAALDHSFNILRGAYQIVNARQLFHNRSEITVHLTK